MSDEKRQTRLLPFRLRRTGARRAGAGGPEDFGADAELTALLREWEAPRPGASAHDRLLADFRASARVAPLWRRALAAHVRVPLPVAACAALALLLTPLAFGARPWTKPAPSAAAREAAPAVRVVEVPVIQERVVERVVYVEKKERGAGRGVSSQPEQSDGRVSLASAEPPAARRAEAPEQPAQPESGAAAAEASGGYFTRVDMQDFQPPNEVKFRRLSRGSVDEK